MKPLSRLAGLLAALLVTAVALTGTAYAKVTPDDPDAPARAVYDAPPPTIVVESGLSVLQIVGLMLLAAIAAAVVTVIVGRRVPRLAGHTA